MLNESIQVIDAKEKLKNLSQSLKTLRSCREDCNIHMRDLMIDYSCITKVSPVQLVLRNFNIKFNFHYT